MNTGLPGPKMDREIISLQIICMCKGRVCKFLILSQLGHYSLMDEMALSQSALHNAVSVLQQMYAHLKVLQWLFRVIFLFHIRAPIFFTMLTFSPGSINVPPVAITYSIASLSTNPSSPFKISESPFLALSVEVSLLNIIIILYAYLDHKVYLITSYFIQQKIDVLSVKSFSLLLTLDVKDKQQAQQVLGKHLLNEWIKAMSVN